MQNYFYGEYRNTLDDKGRIAFPTKLKEILNGDTVWITKGMDNDKSLIIYSPAEWEQTLDILNKKLNMYKSDSRWLYRKFVAPAKDVIIDKAGRLAIPQTLREYANLKKDCIFLGMGSMIELWDAQTFIDEDNKVLESGISSFEELGNLLSNSSLE